MKDIPHSVAGFIRFLNLKSLRARTLEAHRFAASFCQAFAHFSEKSGSSEISASPLILLTWRLGLGLR